MLGLKFINKHINWGCQKLRCFAVQLLAVGHAMRLEVKSCIPTFQQTIKKQEGKKEGEGLIARLDPQF